MVIAQVERSLKQFLEDNGEDIKEVILARFGSSDRKFNNSDPLGQLYWRELWDLASEYIHDNDRSKNIKALRKKAETDSAIKARNAIAHGNRTFLPHYWYTIAAIVTSPEFESLEFEEVKYTFIAAEEGKFPEGIPPLETIEQYFSKIPNNLPEPEFSKFFGREKEKRDLKEAINSNRMNTIAVCGPGGTGKTALIIKVLNDFLLTNKFDRIYFYSFKTEKLTSAGISRIGVKSEIKDLELDLKDFLGTGEDKNSIKLSDFNDISVCVCIDNLEDILAEEDEIIFKFLETIPEHWKVIFSSRITPRDSKLISVTQLTNENSRSLLFDYSHEKYGKDFVNNYRDNFDLFIKELSGNPLALKLSIDLLNSGTSSEVVATEVKSMISDFSFTKLEDYLDDDSIYLLELIRQIGFSSRATIAEILDWERDQLSSSLKDIERSSLVVKEYIEDIQHFSCSNFTKSFLLRNNKASLVRQTISQKIKKYHNSASAVKSKGAAIFGYDKLFSIPNDLSSHCLDIISSFKKVFILGKQQRDHGKSTEEISGALSQWESVSSNSFKATSYYWMIRGQLLTSINDPEAVECFEMAVEKDSTNSKAIYILLNHYFYQYNYTKAVEVIDKYPDAPSLDDRIKDIYIKCLMFTNDPANLFKIIEMFSDALDDPTKSTYYIGAVRRIFEIQYDEIKNYIFNSLKVIDEFYDEYSDKQKGYANEFIVTAIQRSISWDLTYEPKEQLYLEKAILNIISFGHMFKKLEKLLSMNLTEVFRKLESLNPQIQSTKIAEAMNNVEKNNYENDDVDLIRKISNKELILVLVKRMQETFCFCADIEGNQYFLPFSKFIGENWMRSTICEGSILAAAPPEKAGKEGNYPVILEAYLFREIGTEFESLVNSTFH
jgi:DNA polymerase III delta prime subunit